MLILGTILAVLAAITIACPLPGTYSIRRRWYGVGNPTGDEPYTNNAWPVVQTAAGATRSQPVRYCWTSHNDYDRLHEVFEKAVEIWEVTFSQSALSIRSDTGTEDNPHALCICGQSGVRADALYVSDITGEDEYQGSAGVTTMGYEYRNAQAGRHILKFRRTESEGGKVSQVDVTLMAHEIGHAIGLDHEHSRPDAAQWIEFRCENLLDYEDVKKRIEESDEGHTIEDACKDRYIALKYGFSAWAYLPAATGVLGSAQWSKQFDDESLMIYGSYDGGKDGLPVLLRKNRNRASTPDLVMGGTLGILPSFGDIARVRQLYPEDDFDAEEQNHDEPAWAPISSPLVEKRAVETGERSS